MPKNWPFFGIFSNVDVNVARFARNVDWDFFCDFQTLCNVTQAVSDFLETKITISVTSVLQVSRYLT